MWQEALKLCLKDSMQLPSEDGYNLQQIIRLNISQAYIEQKNYTEALAVTSVVLNQNPDHIKALYKEALCLLELQDLQKASVTVNHMLTIEPQNPGSISLRKRLQKEISESLVASSKLDTKFSKALMMTNDDKKTKMTKEEIAMEEALEWAKNPNNPSVVWLPHDSEWAGAPHGNESTTTTSSFEEKAQTQMQEGYAIPVRWGQVIDPKMNLRGTAPYLLSSPLTLLQGLEQMTSEGNCMPPEVLKGPSLCILVAGARGYSEMREPYSTFFKRLPNLRHLTVIFVGFTEEKDVWAEKIPSFALSPPLPKWMDKDGNPCERDADCCVSRMDARLFKGNLSQFLSIHLHSKLEELKCVPDCIFLPNQDIAHQLNIWAPAITLALSRGYSLLATGVAAADKYLDDVETPTDVPFNPESMIGISTHDLIFTPKVLEGLIVPVSRVSPIYLSKPHLSRFPLPLRLSDPLMQWQGQMTEPKLLESHVLAKNAFFIFIGVEGTHRYCMSDKVRNQNVNEACKNLRGGLLKGEGVEKLVLDLRNKYDLDARAE